MISESINNLNTLKFIIHKTNISRAPRRADNKHETLKQFRVNVRSSSATLAQHENSIGSTFYWVKNEIPWSHKLVQGHMSVNVVPWELHVNY